MFFVHGLWPILAAQVVVASGGALGGPSLIALTMATIGKDGFPRQQGINQAATHTGNVVAAGLVWATAFAIGPASSIAVLGVMATGMLIVLWFYPRDKIDHTRMAGREPRKKGEKRGSTRALLRNKRLIVVIRLHRAVQLRRRRRAARCWASAWPPTRSCTIRRSGWRCW